MRQSFGPRLKAERERQGITLEQIAESTKIKASILAQLEQNDVSRWPKGIFRRAFFRDYAAAIGVAFEPTWAEFVQLFPDDSTSPAPPPAPTQPKGDVVLFEGSGAGLRLTLDAERRALVAFTPRQLLAALGDVAAVLTVAAAAAWAGAPFWASFGVVAVIYHAAATTYLGRSVGSWLMHGRVSTGVRYRPHLVHSAPQSTGENDARPAESAAETARLTVVERERRSGGDRRRATRPFIASAEFAAGIRH